MLRALGYSHTQILQIAIDFSVVRHQNQLARGPDYSEVSGQEQESFETPLRFACEPVFLGFEDPLAEGTRTSGEEGDAREAM